MTDPTQAQAEGKAAHDAFWAAQGVAKNWNRAGRLTQRAWAAVEHALSRRAPPAAPDQGVWKTTTIREGKPNLVQWRAWSRQYGELGMFDTEAEAWSALPSLGVHIRNLLERAYRVCQDAWKDSAVEDDAELDEEIAAALAKAGRVPPAAAGPGVGREQIAASIRTTLWMTLPLEAANARYSEYEGNVEEDVDECVVRILALLLPPAAASWKCAAARGTADNPAYANCDWPVCGCDPAADKVIAALEERGAPSLPPPPAAAGLHPETARLVQDFSVAVADKLREAERKYGYSDEWRTMDWEAECQRQLAIHVAKGDPRDVAAYAAFCWARGWQTTAPAAEGGLVEALEELLGSFEAARVEGLNEALAAEDSPRLADLIRRRLIYSEPQAITALAAHARRGGGGEATELRRTLADVVAQIRAKNWYEVSAGDGPGAIGDAEVWERAQRLAPAQAGGGVG